MAGSVFSPIKFNSLLSRPRAGPGRDADLVRVSGGQTGPGLPPGHGHQGHEGQLRQVQCRHLQRARDHGLVSQLHGAQEPPDTAGQVRRI